MFILVIRRQICMAVWNRSLKFVVSTVNCVTMHLRTAEMMLQYFCVHKGNVTSTSPKSK